MVVVVASIRDEARCWGGEPLEESRYYPEESTCSGPCIFPVEKSYCGSVLLEMICTEGDHTAPALTLVYARARESGAGVRSDVIPSALLQFDQAPSASLGVIHVFGHPSDADGVSDELNAILHAGGEFVGLDVAVDVHFLRAAGDDEDRDVARFEEAGGEDVDVADVEDAAVGFQAGDGVLLREGGVDLELGGGEPELEGFDVALDVGVQNLGEDVFPHLPQKGLDLETGVHFPEFLDHARRLIFREKVGEAIGDASCSRDQRILRFIVRRFEREERLHQAAGVLEIAPRLLPGGVFVDGDVRPRAGISSARYTQDLGSKRQQAAARNLLGIFLDFPHSPARYAASSRFIQLPQFASSPTLFLLRPTSVS